MSYRNDISINICSRYVWISLNGNSGMLTINHFFLAQRNIKKLIKDLKTLVKFEPTTSDALITKCFPEVVTEEFERTILGKKDDK